MQKVPVWVRHIVLIITSFNIEIFLEMVDICLDIIPEINSRIGFFEILYVLQEFVGEVTGRGGMVDI